MALLLWTLWWATQTCLQIQVRYTDIYYPIATTATTHWSWQLSLFYGQRELPCPCLYSSQMESAHIQWGVNIEVWRPFSQLQSSWGVGWGLLCEKLWPTCSLHFLSLHSSGSEGHSKPISIAGSLFPENPSSVTLEESHLKGENEAEQRQLKWDTRENPAVPCGSPVLFASIFLLCRVPYSSKQSYRLTSGAQTCR